MNTSRKHASYDENEVAKFEAMAAEWWDPTGKFKPLHMLNPTRLKFITENIAAHYLLNLDENVPLKDMRIVDIGCGGGLVTEPLARLGADMLGIDAAERNIPVAQVHADQSGLEIDYRHGFAESLVEDGEQFDVVLALEVIEHVAKPEHFFDMLTKLVKPGGLIVVSTINRNPKSYMMAIVGAEYVMRWLPKGTHEWNKFLTPAEIEGFAAQPDIRLVDKQGFVFNPLNFTWSLSRRDLSVNYAMAFSKATA